MQIESIITDICTYIEENFNIKADRGAVLLGQGAILSSLTVMMLVGWCETNYGIRDLLGDDLFLDSLSSVTALAIKIFGLCMKLPKEKNMIRKQKW